MLMCENIYRSQILEVEALRLEEDVFVPTLTLAWVVPRTSEQRRAFEIGCRQIKNDTSDSLKLVFIKKGEKMSKAKSPQT